MDNAVRRGEGSKPSEADLLREPSAAKRQDIAIERFLRWPVLRTMAGLGSDPIIFARRRGTIVARDSQIAPQATAPRTTTRRRLQSCPDFIQTRGEDRLRNDSPKASGRVVRELTRAARPQVLAFNSELH